MAARKKAATRKQAPARKRAPARKTTARGKDAIALLKADHALVQGLFDRFEKARGDDRKRALAEKICQELRVHTQIEEEIFYPAAREVLRDEDLMDEAEVEHAGAKDLIGQIESSSPGAELYDAKVTVLGEYIKHHVKEEHEEMFPKLRKTKLDMQALGERLQARKTQLQEGGVRRRVRVPAAGELTGSSRGGKRREKPEDEGFMSGLAREIGLKH
jgi:hemerythrin superfamily protein